MRRFFLPSLPDGDHDSLELTGPEARHLTQVLRLRPGDEVEFFDGAGRIARARLEAVEAGRVTARLAGFLRERTAAAPRLVLAQALLKGKKMDFLAQKANELGVEALLPLVTRFCERRDEGEAAATRRGRIVIESCKQCGRAIPMRLAEPLRLEDADFSWAALKLVAWENERAAALPEAEIRTTPGPICLVIGPEGGLHEDEAAFLRDQGFRSFSLGPLILRAETAAIAAAALIRHLSGALGPQV